MIRVKGLRLSSHLRSEAKCREAPRQGGLSGDSGKRFRVCSCARKLVSGPRGQGQVWVTAC